MRVRHFNVPYRVILLGTFSLTVVFDLTVAVEMGLVLARVFVVWRMSQLFQVQSLALPSDTPPGVQCFELYGSLFFGAVGRLEALPAQLDPGTRRLVLAMPRLVSMDSSGLDALEQLHNELSRRDVALVLAQVNSQPLSLMQRAGFAQKLGAAALAGRGAGGYPPLESAASPRPHHTPPCRCSGSPTSPT